MSDYTELPEKKFITNHEIVFQNMRAEYNSLKEKYPFLSSFEIGNHVMNDVELYVAASVQAEYSAKKLFTFWLSRNM